MTIFKQFNALILVITIAMQHRMVFADHHDKDTPKLASKTKCELLPEEYRNTEQDHEQDCLFEQWYVTASIGYASGDFSATDVTRSASAVGFDVFDIDIDDSRTAGKIAVGASLTERFSMELGWVDLGEVQAAFSTNTDDPDSFFALTNNIHPTSTEGVALSGVYQFLRHEEWFLQFRLGLYFWDGDFDSLDVFGARPVPNNSDRDGTDIYFGAGANYQLDESLQLLIEWERYRFDIDDTDLLSIGVTYHF